MKRVRLDRAKAQVKEFFRSLPVSPTGWILELEGKPLLKILPVTEVTVDQAKLKAAILKRRDQSRKLNEEWEAVDRETWDRLSEAEG